MGNINHILTFKKALFDKNINNGADQCDVPFMVSKDGTDGFPNLIIMSTAKLEFETIFENIIKDGSELIGVPVKLYRKPLTSLCFKSSRNKNPLLLMNPIDSLDKVADETYRLRELMESLKIKPECQNCAPDKETNRHRAEMIAHNCLFLGKTLDRAALDNFIYHLITARNDGYFKDMLMTSILLENGDCMLILWRDYMKTMQDLYDSFVVSKLLLEPDIKYKLHSNDYHTLDYWKYPMTSLDKSFKPYDSLLANSMRQFKQYISESPINASNMLTRCTFRTFETNSKEEVKVFYTGPKFSKVWLGKQIFNTPMKEFQVLEVCRDKKDTTRVRHFFSIVRTPGYSLQRLKNDFLGTMKYKESHTCWRCHKFPISNVLASQMSQKKFLLASERLQNCSLIFNDFGAIVGNDERFKDSLGSFLESNQFLLSSNRICPLNNLKKTMSFLSIKNNNGVQRMAIILKNRSLTLSDAGTILWRIKCRLGCEWSNYDSPMYLHADHDLTRCFEVEDNEEKQTQE